MKRYMFILLLLVSSKSYSQLLSFTSDMLKHCLIEKGTSEPTNCEMFDDYSMFQINDAETVLTHTNTRGKLVYFIEKSWTENNEDDFYFNVTSADGLKAVFRLNLPSKTFNMFYKEGEQTEVAVFYIKNTF